MKRAFLLITVAAAALLSCSQDEIKKVNLGEQINFRTALGTRGAEVTTDNLNSFQVTALSSDASETEPYFENVTFSREENTSTFASAIPNYWPEKGSLNFYAWSNAGEAVADYSDAASVVIPDYTPAATIAEQKDVVVGSASGDKANNSSTGVQMTFKHALSQIAIYAKNTNTKCSYTVNIKGARINNVNSKADLPVSSGDVSAAESSVPATYEVALSNPVTITNTTSEPQAVLTGAMLIPQQLTKWSKDNTSGAYLSLLVDVDTNGGADIYPESGDTDGYAWAQVSIDTKWERNTKYTYILDFKEGVGSDDGGEDILAEITFVNVKVSKWTDASSENLEIEM